MKPGFFCTEAACSAQAENKTGGRRILKNENWEEANRLASKVGNKLADSEKQLGRERFKNLTNSFLVVIDILDKEDLIYCDQIHSQVKKMLCGIKTQLSAAP